MRAFSYFSRSDCPFHSDSADRKTYLNCLGLIGSFQKASYVTKGLCTTSFQLCPGYGGGGTGAPSLRLSVTSLG